ncbi:carbohydrate esterase family 1 protein [Boletus coccyginus]|nr:carbohydrate esterase family 1 protein [Boletus coccyginus]
MATPLEKISSIKHYEGTLTKYKFKSAVLGGLDAQFNLFLPANAAQGKVPILVYLAGLTCTEDNGAQKGGFVRDAATEGIAILFPDTSPRGAGIEDEAATWDFGVGKSSAGFYLNATRSKWAKYYNMLDHVTKELPEVIEAAGIPIDFSRQSIFGHSMGGHGALTIYLNSLISGTKQYRSCSAFSPICEPSVAPWGQKAFKGYLAGGMEEGKTKYDASVLVGKVKGAINILIDYGTADTFLYQLRPEAFLKAARDAGHDEVQVRVRCHEGYDHSYYFISSFASDHIHFHANFLKA